MKVNLGDLVCITWEDHWGTAGGGWRPQDATDMKPMLCQTVGWVIAQDKDRLLTASSHDGQMPNPSVSAVSCCPKRMVSEIKVLKRGNPADWKK